MKFTKKVTAFLLAALMVLSFPAAAFAENYDIGVTISQSENALFEGGEYTITATIPNASKADAESGTVFEWESSPRIDSLQNSSNKKIELNNDGVTYTVKQDAKITMPTAGTTFSVTAKYGTSTKTVSYTTKQPITSFDFSSAATEHSYYDSKTNTIYADRRESKSSTNEYFNLALSNILPAAHDDYYPDSSIFQFSSTLTKTLDKEDLGENSYKFYIPNDAAGKFQLKMQTFSNLNTKNCDVQICVPAESYKLKNAESGLEICEVTESNSGELSAMSMIQGEATTINATLSPTASNDDIKYTLYKSDNTTVVENANNEYYTQNGNNCTITGKLSQGTYYIRVKNYSKDNGMLTRELGEKTILLSVNKASYISSIQLFKVEDGIQTDKALTETTLYNKATAENKRTFNLAECVVCTPTVENTTGDSYYFESSNTSIATVSNTGKIEAKGKGNATIFVKSTKNANAYATLNVTVKTGTTNLQINKEDGSAVIASGHVEKMIATRTPSDADDELYWYSSDDAVLHIDSNSGIITAGTVNSPTTVKISANADSLSTESSMFIDVVPAVRAQRVELSAKAYNSDGTESDSQVSADKEYRDYFIQSGKRKYFIVTSDAIASSGESNDVLSWKISYENGAGLTFDEAAEEGLIAYDQKGLANNQYKITPQRTGKFNISCVATLNANDIKDSDANDTITVNMLQTANTITLKDEETKKDVSGTIYLPIGGKKTITVKTSTPENDKKTDPPIYTVKSGGDYLSVTQKPSADGEGVTYTVTGLKYGTEVSKIVFASKSNSINKTISFYVRNNLNDSNVEIKGVPESVQYTGSSIKFDDTFEIFANGSSVDKSQYSVSYSDNTNAGTATIKITGKNNFAGSYREQTFKIVPKPFDSSLVINSIDDRSLSKTTRKVEPTPSVKFNNRTLSSNTDFTYSYTNNNRAGWATVTITGKGNYKGTASAKFKVIDTAELFVVSAIPVQTYSGKEIKPSPVVKYKGKVLKKDTDYTLEYSNNINSGNATVTVKGIGFYKNSISQKFQIKPRPAYLKKVKKGKKKFTAKWSKMQDISGYQIMYARNKKFKKGKKSVWLTDTNATSFTVEKLKRKKTYYVCIRAYKNVDGNKVYGNWSKVKKVKVK